MYVNQKCYVKWANKLSEPFTVANGVKQDAVISPLLFSIYIDNLFKELKQLGLLDRHLLGHLVTQMMSP